MNKKKKQAQDRLDRVKKQKKILTEHPLSKLGAEPAADLKKQKAAAETAAAAVAEKPKDQVIIKPEPMSKQQVEAGSLSLVADPLKIPKKTEPKPEPGKKAKEAAEKKAAEIELARANFALLFIGLTRAVSIVAKEPELEATQQEAEDLDQGLNQLIAMSAPKLQKYYPAMLIAIPLANYGMRVAAVMSRKQKQQQPEQVKK